MRFSELRVLKEGLTGNKGWTPHWRDPEPKAEYDVIIIGGGGHGLATAHYLASVHGITNVAVLEKRLFGRWQCWSQYDDCAGQLWTAGQFGILQPFA